MLIQLIAGLLAARAKKPHTACSRNPLDLTRHTSNSQ